jgi:stearoyl-CoA desaturase (delta-9 desaturase)
VHVLELVHMTERPVLDPGGGPRSAVAERPRRVRAYDPEGRYDGTSPFDAFGETTIEEHGAPRRIQVALTLALVVLPVIGVALAGWLTWGSGLGWVEVGLFLGFWLVSGLGVTVGYHRGLTHRSFTAVPALRTSLAVAGSLALQGDPISWVATHRRHHAYTDRPGDPHSPYRYGTGMVGQLRGLLHAHMGWLLRNDRTPPERWAPDLLADKGIRRVSQAFMPLGIASLVLPAVLGGLITWSISGALLGFLWGGVVRVAFLHHVTWSVNSLCHMFGERPFTTREHDRATNLWPLAVPSLGESWHNGHHADPTCARHGVEKGQVDVSAEVIRVFEKLGWVNDVHWPKADRFTRTASADA